MWVWKGVWPQEGLKWCGLWWQWVWQILRASLGSNFENVNFGQKCTFLQNRCLVKPSKFVTVTVIIGHTIWVLLVATPLSTPTLFDFLMISFRFLELNFQTKAEQERTLTDGIHNISTYPMCTKFDILNHDDILISGVVYSGTRLESKLLVFLCVHMYIFWTTGQNWLKSGDKTQIPSTITIIPKKYFNASAGCNNGP